MKLSRIAFGDTPKEAVNLGRALRRQIVSQEIPIAFGFGGVRWIDANHAAEVE